MAEAPKITRIPWHCPGALDRPLSELCPECQERRRQKNRSTQATYRQTNAVNYSGHLPGLSFVNCHRGPRRPWRCEGAHAKKIAELCPTCAARRRANSRKSIARRRAVERYVAAG